MSVRTRVTLSIVPLGLLLALTLFFTSAVSLPAGAMVAPDTVFGPQAFVTATGAPQQHVEQFSVTVQPGRHYALTVTNGAPDGTLRISSAVVVLNGDTLFTQNDFNQTVGFLTVAVEPQATNQLEVRVEGAPEGYLTIVLTGATDAQFTVYGPERFERASGTPNPAFRTFTIPGAAAAPFTLYIANGDVDGTDRLSSAYIYVNGVQVLSPSDLNQQVGAVVKSVTLQATNQLEVNLQSSPGSFLTLWFTATDTTPPVLTITTPAAGAITGATEITVAGTVTDETAVTLTLNGVETPVTNDAFSGTVPLPDEGQNTILVSAVDAAGNQTDSARTVIRDTEAPLLTVNVPADGLITNQTTVTVSGTVTDATPVTVNANGVPLPVDGAGVFTGEVALNEGANFLTVTATDAASNQATTVRVVTRDTQAPVLALAEPADGSTTTEEAVPVSGTVTDLTAVTVVANAQPLPVEPDGSFSGTVPVVLGANTIAVTATDAAGNSRTETRSVTRLTAGPPDPAVVATPIIPTEASLLLETTAFLYEGENPIQQGVAPGTIELVRAAVVRGRVLDRNLEPLAGAAISVAGHPEFGSTESRADGAFDLAVNGGGTLVFDIQKAGYLPAQRHVDVPWQLYSLPDDVILLQADSVVTLVDLTSPDIQVAQASVQTDADGPRQATVFFPPGTQAVLTRPDGTVDTLTSLAIRATEFTVGDNGPAAMPAALPPTSHYTYAVQVTADAQLAAGPGAMVTLSQPAPFYVENFLDIPLGTPVPTGVYDAEVGQWLPQPNGVVLKILGTDANGLALLDINGDGIPDSDSLLTFYGIEPLERFQLAGSFQANIELWRTEIQLLAPYDLNFGFRVLGGQQPDVQVTGPCGASGADVLRCELQVQTAFQTVGIVGAPFTLHYASDRTRGNVADRQLHVPLIPGPVPAELLRVDLVIDVAGKRFSGSFLPAPDLTHDFTWDGVDGYGRTPQSTQPARVRIGYVYPIAYTAPAEGASSFGRTCTRVTPDACDLDADVQSPARQTTTVWQDIRTSLGGLDAAGMGLGGFTFDVQHHYDPIGGILYEGTGGRRASAGLPGQIALYAGTGLPTNLNDTRPLLDPAPATSANAKILRPRGLAFGPDGSLYVGLSTRIRRVFNGVVTTVAGSGHPNIGGFGGDGGPATQALVNGVHGLGRGPDGSLYFADQGNFRIRRVDPQGIITTIAGTGAGCPSNDPCGNGGPATAARMGNLGALAVGADGSVYFTEESHHRIRRIGPDGIIRTVLGGPQQCISNGQGYASSCGEGVPGSAVKLRLNRGLAIGPDGSLYFGTEGFGFGTRVRRMGPDGIVTTIAGSDGPTAVLGDGGPALQATLQGIFAIGVGPDGTVYVAEAASAPHFRVRQIRPDGFITTVAGNGVHGSGGNNGPALRAQVKRVEGIAVGPDGALYLADDDQIRRVAAPLPGLLPGTTVLASADGSELYVFSPAGRILLTLDAVLGDTIQVFSYNIARQLVGIRDRNGRVTTLQRDSVGQLAAVVAANGQETSVSVTDGEIVFGDPAGGMARIALDPSGKVAAVTDPNGRITTFDYDGSGQLIRTVGADLSEHLMSVERTPDSTIASITTAGGTQTALTTSTTTNGVQEALATISGLTSRVQRAPTGASQVAFSDGTTALVTEEASTFGLQAARRRLTVGTPGGVEFSSRSTGGTLLGTLGDTIGLVDSLVVNGQVNVRTTFLEERETVDFSPEGRIRLTGLDPQGRAELDSIPGLAGRRANFSSDGLLLSRTFGDRAWSYEYDSHDRHVRTMLPDSASYELAYDAANRPIRRINERGDTVAVTWDPDGRVRALRTPLGAIHSFTHDSLGNRMTYEPPSVPNGGPHLRFAHDPDGRILSVVRQSGDSIRFSYDSAGRVETIEAGGVTATHTYDSTTGQLRTLTSPFGSVLSLVFDGALPVELAWSGVTSGMVELTYNSDLVPILETVNGLDAISYQYDGDGFLTAAGPLAIARDAENGLPVATNLGGLETSSTFSTLGELETLTAYAGSDTVFQATVQRDAAGRLVQSVDVIGQDTVSWTYVYDQLGQLTSAARAGVVIVQNTYDANGNRTAGVESGVPIAGVFDLRDRLVSYGGRGYEYAPDGELVRVTDGADTTQLTYAFTGQLQSVRLPGGTVVGYIYDVLGRRIARSIDGVTVSRWLYGPGMAPVAEVDSLGVASTRFVYGERENVPSFMLRNGVTYRVITDRVGSVRLVVNAHTGAIAQRIDYDPFGHVLLNTNPSFQPFGFAGGLQDELTGMVRLGIRDYDPITGRWTTRDPALFEGGDVNLYRYAFNDPVNRLDPTGLSPLIEFGYANAFFGRLNLIAAHAVVRLPFVSSMLAVGATGLKVMIRTRQLMSSPGLVRLQQAASRGVHAAERFGDELLSYEPGIPSRLAAMTNYLGRGFHLGRSAFSSTEQLVRTLLQELYRLHTSVATTGASIGGQIVSGETGGTVAAVDKMYQFGRLLGWW